MTEQQLIKWVNVRHCRVALEQIQAIDVATMRFLPLRVHLKLIEQLREHYEAALYDYEKGEPH